MRIISGLPIRHMSGNIGISVKKCCALFHTAICYGRKQIAIAIFLATGRSEMLVSVNYGGGYEKGDQ